MTDVQVEIARTTAKNNPIHNHFVELIHAWNLNPFKRNSADGVAAVDELSEERGISLFSFTSKEGREDFVDFYGLEDFVIHRRDVGHHWLTLRNQFETNDVTNFMLTYSEAMDTIAQIENERVAAMRNSGHQVGFICADTFTWRVTNELTLIRAAREKLGRSGLRVPFENKGGK